MNINDENEEAEKYTVKVFSVYQLIEYWILNIGYSFTLILWIVILLWTPIYLLIYWVCVIVCVCEWVSECDTYIIIKSYMIERLLTYIITSLDKYP